ncbi:MAG TPA: MBL fold metallo-hydrolase [Anaeromyxobacter sp.]|nr:MBL fold metallo-hydrolase [Anaeromyxobacter sp.]
MTEERRTLKFLGTAGARHVVSTQLRHSGGLVWSLGAATIWVDPGPGALVRALASRPKVDPARVDVLVLTHRHLDHAGDATAVVEAMTKGGFGKRAMLLAPRDALEDDPVVFRYAQGFVARRALLAEGSRHELAPGVALETPLAHDHGVETYGYRLTAPGLAAAHVVDTFWLDRLPEAYAGVDLLLVNTTRERGRDKRLLHLGADDAEILVREIRPKLAVLTHFGMQLVRAPPERIALGIAERTGVPTVAARDGWLLPLDDLAAAAARGRGPAAPASSPA